MMMMMMITIRRRRRRREIFSALFLYKVMSTSENKKCPHPMLDFEQSLSFFMDSRLAEESGMA